ncbi:MAG: polysaccharide biosynthesis tyrosine autokinase [Gemmatimonadota bacterium]
MNEHPDTPERLPAVQARRPYEIQAHESYALDAFDGGDGLDVRRLFESLWRWKWLVAGCTLLGVAAGLVASRFVQPVYEVEATIWLEEDNKSGALRGEDPLAGEGWSSVFRSNAVVGPVVEDMQLYLAPGRTRGVDSTAFETFEMGGRVAAGSYTLTTSRDGSYELALADTSAVERGRLGSPIGGLFGFVWTPPRSAFDDEAEARFSVLSMRQARARVRSALVVRYIDEAGIIVARLTWPDRSQAAPLLNALQAQFITTATDLKNAQLRETVAILQEQTGVAADRLVGAELTYQNFRVGAITQPSEQQFFAPGGGSGRGSVLGTGDPVFGAFFGKKLEQREIEAELDQLGAILRESRGGGPVDVLTLMTMGSPGEYPVLRSTLSQLNDKEAARRTLMLTYTEQAEPVQLVAEEINHIKTVIIPDLIGDLITQLSQRLATLNSELAAETDELRAIPRRTIEEARLERELRAAEELHGNLQRSLKAAELTEATSSPGLQVLDRASPPLGPTEDTIPRIMLMASLAGLGLGLAGALLLDKMDKRIRYPDQVEKGLGLPVLGIVPRLDQSSGVDANVAVESFRSIRVQISHSNGTSRGLVLVTSPAPRDGKSMVSANLAISYASAGYRTILIDADIRRGHAEEMFGVERSPGLSDYLKGKVPAADVRQATKIDGLTMVAKGAGTHFNLELLDSDLMDSLLDELRSDFDVVVLDAPPLAAGADALVLGKRADKVVVVLRAGETDEVLARTKLDLIGNVDVPIVGAVLNAVPTNSHYYPYYANYYYQAEPV